MPRSTKPKEVRGYNNNMKLNKFSLMNPDEVDSIEHLQQTVFRPNSFNQAKETARNLLNSYKSKKKLGKEEKAMQKQRRESFLQSVLAFTPVEGSSAPFTQTP